MLFNIIFIVVITIIKKVFFVLNNIKLLEIEYSQDDLIVKVVNQILIKTETIGNPKIGTCMTGINPQGIEIMESMLPNILRLNTIDVFSKGTIEG